LTDERLPIPHAIVLGAIQGPAELLPVSSSGHLVLVPAVLGWRYRAIASSIRRSANRSRSRCTREARPLS
jgi:undecaprenyl pyrophosphate phosphatase UppP